MKFFADECVFGITVNFLISHGLDVITAQEEKLRGRDDEELIAHSKRIGRVFITNDKDFADIHKFPPRLFEGIIRLKIRKSTAESVHRNLLDVLNDVPPEKFIGTLIVVDKNKYRIRR